MYYFWFVWLFYAHWFWADVALNHHLNTNLIIRVIIRYIKPYWFLFFIVYNCLPSLRVWRLRSAAIKVQVEERVNEKCEHCLLCGYGDYEVPPSKYKLKSKQTKSVNIVYYAGMAKLVDALDLGSSGATHKSSSLFTRTIFLNQISQISHITNKKKYSHRAR